MKTFTFKEVIDLIGNREFAIELDGGKTLTAYCWTDDPEVLEWPATFDVVASWRDDGSIGMYDNLKGELDIPIMRLADEIGKAVPGIKLLYSDPDGYFEQPK
ncbi:MAG: hypothetical protein IIW14_05970 [Kiritimatiellae bacterium]|nr:hypothetical protein [Kiritimatiellia bacterium]